MTSWEAAGLQQAVWGKIWESSMLAFVFLEYKMNVFISGGGETDLVWKTVFHYSLCKCAPQQSKSRPQMALIGWEAGLHVFGWCASSFKSLRIKYKTASSKKGKKVEI